jgi:hypothetical protein
MRFESIDMSQRVAPSVVRQVDGFGLNTAALGFNNADVFIILVDIARRFVALALHADLFLFDSSCLLLSI